MSTPSPTPASTTQEAAATLLAAGGTMLARWVEGLTPDQVQKFEALLAAGGVPGADVLLAPDGPVVALYVQDPNGQRHRLVSATAPVAPPLH